MVNEQGANPQPEVSASDGAAGGWNEEGATPVSPSDEELMLRVQADDFRAFEALFERYQGRIFSYFARLTFDRAVAEDYTQDVFTRLWSAREHYRPSGRFISYIYQIARNHWINENKRRSNRPDGAALDGVLADTMSEQAEEQPLQTVLRSELAQMIEQALQEIPEEQREVFVLSRFEQLRYQEIAEIVGAPVRTVESRLVLATRKLMAKLATFRKVE